ncbi:hypothetical protein AX14_009826, partial [Amanita brunnescens Koide BX004]
MSNPGPSRSTARVLKRRADVIHQSSVHELIHPCRHRANPSTIQDKFLVGYQGWFTCPGDGAPIAPGHHGWLHWFNRPLPDGGRPTLDLWPDVSSYSPSELFAAPGLKSDNGEQLFLFSSRHPKTVRRHFHWMAEHGVDGAFLQRFLGQCDLEKGNEGIRRIRDEVGDRVREAAEEEGRVFAIMYDVTGVDPSRIVDVIERDWIHLLHEKYILDSPNYLRESGKAVVALWGFGFDKRRHTPEMVRAVTSFLRNNTPGGAYIMGGAPSQWRTSEGDADRNREFLDVWLTEFDAISPWTIGRYSNENEADKFAEARMKGDMELLKRRNESKRIDYIPVVLPGGSGYNLSEGKWGLNNIKRNGGRFLWRQIVNSRRLGVRIMYGAMWDEYDEGTAFLPAVPNKRLLPVHDKFPFLALDSEGYDLPSDWYMRICGLAAEVLRSERLIHETFPIKELQDYWTSRPKFEECNKEDKDNVPSGPVDESGATQLYQNWLASQNEGKEEVPPPPYSLVDEEGQASEEQAIAATVNLPQASGGPSPASSHVTSLPPPTAPTSPASLTSNLHMAQASSQSPVTIDPVTSLTDEFGRQMISEAPDPSPVSQTSRPPSHPARANAYLQMPEPSRPLSYTSRPTSTQPQPGTGISLPSIASVPISAEPQSSGPWSQTPSTPSDLPLQEALYSAYSGQIKDHQHQPLGAPSARPYSPSYITTSTSSAPHNFPIPSSGEPYRPSSLVPSPGSVSQHFPSTSNLHATSPVWNYSPQSSGQYSGAQSPGTLPGSRPYGSPSPQGNTDYYHSGRPAGSPPATDGQHYHYGSGYSPSYVPYGSNHQSYNTNYSTGQYNPTPPPSASGPGVPYGNTPYAAGRPTGPNFRPGGMSSG